jgi:hypothetical protein
MDPCTYLYRTWRGSRDLMSGSRLCTQATIEEKYLQFETHVIILFLNTVKGLMKKQGRTINKRAIVENVVLSYLPLINGISDNKMAETF